jgi:hypothetical protein
VVALKFKICWCIDVSEFKKYVESRDSAPESAAVQTSDSAEASHGDNHEDTDATPKKRGRATKKEPGSAPRRASSASKKVDRSPSPEKATPQKSASKRTATPTKARTPSRGRGKK